MWFRAGMARSVTATALLAAGLAASGCVHYVAVDPATVDPELEVRVHVTPDAAIRTARDLGSITQRLEGRLIPRDPDSVQLSVWIGRSYPGTPFANARTEVMLSRREIIDIRRPEFSRVRTGLAAAAILAVTALLVKTVVMQEDPNPAPGPGHGLPPIVDLRTIPIPLPFPP